MLIAAALIQLVVPDGESLKARRSVANAVKARVRSRFRISIAEVGDPEDRHEVLLGCVEVGSDPRVMRERMQRVVSFVEGLGLAEVGSDDVVVARLDEIDEVPAEPEDPPEAWRRT